MSYIAKPSAHHPALPKNTLGLTRRDYEGTMSTLVRRLRARLHHGRADRSLLRDGPPGPPHRQGLRHRLLVQGADLFHEPQPRLQQRARAHALDHDRRQHRQPRSGLYRHLGRRRHGLDRVGPVLPRRAPAAEHDLYRHEQRLLRPHQGPVLRHQRQELPLQEGRGQSLRRHRSVPDGDPARRRLRRPLLLRRQDAAHSRSSRRPSATTALPSST